jgi:hypothetical protein
MEERYTFGTHHLHLLCQLREHLLEYGFTCRVEHVPYYHAKFTTLTHTLIAVPAPRPNRTARGCNLRGALHG